MINSRAVGSNFIKISPCNVWNFKIRELIRILKFQTLKYCLYEQNTFFSDFNIPGINHTCYNYVFF